METEKAPNDPTITAKVIMMHFLVILSLLIIAQVQPEECPTFCQGEENISQALTRWCEDHHCVDGHVEYYDPPSGCPHYCSRRRIKAGPGKKKLEPWQVKRCNKHC